MQHSQLFDTLWFRSNKGRIVGGGKMGGGDLLVGHPCPIGQYKLAFMSGNGPVSNGWGSRRGPATLTFYWLALADASVVQGPLIPRVQLVAGQGLCTGPPPVPPPPSPPSEQPCCGNTLALASQPSMRKPRTGARRMLVILGERLRTAWLSHLAVPPPPPSPPLPPALSPPPSPPLSPPLPDGGVVVVQPWMPA